MNTTEGETTLNRSIVLFSSAARSPRAVTARGWAPLAVDAAEPEPRLAKEAAIRREPATGVVSQVWACARPARRECPRSHRSMIMDSGTPPLMAARGSPPPKTGSPAIIESPEPTCQRLTPPTATTADRLKGSLPSVTSTSIFSSSRTIVSVTCVADLVAVDDAEEIGRPGDGLAVDGDDQIAEQDLAVVAPPGREQSRLVGGAVRGDRENQRPLAAEPPDEVVLGQQYAEAGACRTPRRE